MTKQKTTKSGNIEVLADKLGIKKENLEYGLKKDPKTVEDAIKQAAAFMGVK